MSGTVRQLLLHDVPFSVNGVEADDPYFAGLRDNLEEQLSGIIGRMLPAAPGIWDIGANIGVTALTMAAAAPAGRIVAVEGGPHVYKTLETNVHMNGRSDQIKIVHSAVGESDGQVSFHDSSAYGHIATRDHEGGGVTVPLISAPTLFRQHGPQTIDFIKIDIEGSEFPFLRGGIDLFKQHSSIICMEFNVWCLMYYGRTGPIEFMEWIVRNFADVRLLPHYGLTGSRRVTSENQYVTVASIMHEMQCIANLLFCPVEGKITLP
jgi:FkbM family methyltransferase